MKNSHFFIIYDEFDEELEEVKTYSAWINVMLDENASARNSETAIFVALVDHHIKFHDKSISFSEIHIKNINKVL